MAVDRIPDFKAIPNKSRDAIGEQHKGTIHLNCENMEMLHCAYNDAATNQIASKVFVEYMLKLRSISETFDCCIKLFKSFLWLEIF